MTTRLTTILLLLALNLLPKTSPRETDLAGRLAQGSLATAVGVGVGALAYAIMTRNFQTISDYHLAEAKPEGGGTNVVNVILVDFRGFDTFGEIIVLGIAAITIFALLDTALRGAAARTLDSIRHPEQSMDAHPLILVVATRVLLPLALTVAVFIFMRGHNEPGGGFIAGLIVAIALIMQYLASGYAWAAQRASIDSQAMIGGGIAIAGLTGIASLLLGWPFLTSTHTHIDLPLVGEIEIASAIAFDLVLYFSCLIFISNLESKAASIETPNLTSPDMNSPSVSCY